LRTVQQAGGVAVFAVVVFPLFFVPLVEQLADILEQVFHIHFILGRGLRPQGEVMLLSKLGYLLAGDLALGLQIRLASNHDEVSVIYALLQDLP